MGRIYDARSRNLGTRYHGGSGAAIGPQTKTPLAAISNVFALQPSIIAIQSIIASVAIADSTALTPLIQGNLTLVPPVAIGTSTARTPAASTSAGAQSVTPNAAITIASAFDTKANQSVIPLKAVTYTYSNAPKANQIITAPVAINTSTAQTPSVTNGNTVSDDFAGTGALSGAWSTLGLATATRVGGVFQGSGGGSAYYRNDYSPGSDQTVSITLDVTFSGVGIYARLNIGVGNGYFLSINSVSDNAILYRVDGGVSVGLVSFSGNAWTAGDVVDFKLVGSTLKIFKNGVQIGSDYTDATYSAGGVIGISTQTATDTIAAFAASSP